MNNINNILKPKSKEEIYNIINSMFPNESFLLLLKQKINNNEITNIDNLKNYITFFRNNYSDNITSYHIEKEIENIKQYNYNGYSDAYIKILKLDIEFIIDNYSIMLNVKFSSIDRYDINNIINVSCHTTLINQFKI